MANKLFNSISKQRPMKCNWNVNLNDAMSEQIKQMDARWIMSLRLVMSLVIE